jgi:hypothetical protein
MIRCACFGFFLTMNLLCNISLYNNIHYILNMIQFDCNKITKVLYGISKAYSIDVTDKFKHYILTNEINENFEINDKFGDPYFGIPKMLMILENNDIDNSSIIIPEHDGKLIDPNKFVKCIDDLKNVNNTICFTVCLATYKRSNGKTPEMLAKCINSILDQSYKNFRIVIVGDKYETEDDLEQLVSSFRKKTKNEIILLHNNDVERDHIQDKIKLWYIAGASSMNIGLNYCRKNLYGYYCHIDDDDWWGIDHLRNFAIIYSNFSKVAFVNSVSSYWSEMKLPIISNELIFENNVIPAIGTICHSSISFRSDIIPFDYFTTKNENDITGVADGLMLEKIHEFTIANGYTCICTKKLTAYHDIEQEAL